MTIEVGQAAPDFTLPGDGERTISLAGLRGKNVVLFFYPLDFTFVCPTEIKTFHAQYSKFKDAGAEIISVSTDSSFSHKAWTEHGLGKVDFPIIGDTNHAISRLFGVLIEDKGIALRRTFIIDPQGKVCSATVNDLSVGRSVAETYRVLKGFQTGELVGCGWQPGQSTLKV